MCCTSLSGSIVHAISPLLSMSAVSDTRYLITNNTSELKCTNAAYRHSIALESIQLWPTHSPSVDWMTSAQPNMGILDDDHKFMGSRGYTWTCLASLIPRLESCCIVFFLLLFRTGGSMFHWKSTIALSTASKQGTMNYRHTRITHSLSLLMSSARKSVHRIALDQASRRGWFTYTDLTAIWEATDLQSSMMLATKQTAKVHCFVLLLFVLL